MGIPSPEAVTLIRDAVAATAAKWTVDDRTVLATISAGSIAIPRPQPMRPAEMAISEVMALPAMDQATRAKVFGHRHFVAIRDDMIGQNHAACLLWVAGLVDDGTITADAAAQLTAYINRTEPDPAIPWQAAVSQLEIDLGRTPTIADVAASRPTA